MTYNSERRKRKADATKMKIYASARQLFTVNGYDAVTVSQIVAMAGVSKGSFYVHFASKDELFKTLILDKVEMSDANYLEFFNALPEDTPTDEIVLAFVGRIADVLVEDIGRERMQALYKAQLAQTAGSDVALSYTRALYNMFSHVLRIGIERGDVRLPVSVSLQDMSRHLVLAIRGVTYEWCARGAEFDFKAQALQHFRIILDGLLLKPRGVG
ncbi:MAG: TetR/AcrR family transcriptional regulator [Clostridiaceae bacterium]|nr:TetR/AcrR family transcriptional regulator [Clostridiaceae bacterium]